MTGKPEMGDEPSRNHEAGPYPTYEGMLDDLGADHPAAFKESDNLFWHDGPIVSIGTTGEDRRPRLDVLVEDRHDGGEGTRTFTDVRHQLVFTDEGTLRRTLYEGCAPTRLSYEAAVEIHRYASTSTQTGHPEQRHTMSTTMMRIDDIPVEEMPGDMRPGRRGSEDKDEGKKR